MRSDVVNVEPRGGYRTWLQFQDGGEGEVDLEPLLSFQGVFAPLRDPVYFAQVRVNPDLGTICWPNRTDWDPLVLYSLVTGRPIETLLTGPGSAGGLFLPPETRPVPPRFGESVVEEAAPPCAERG